MTESRRNITSAQAAYAEPPTTAARPLTEFDAVRVASVAAERQHTVAAQRRIWLEFKNSTVSINAKSIRVYPHGGAAIDYATLDEFKAAYACGT